MFAKILVPIDFSPSSHSLLKAAAELAVPLKAEIHLVHVLPMFPASTLPDFAPEEEFIEKTTDDAERQFAPFKADLAAQGIQVTSHIESGNDVVGTILGVVDREHIGMVIISTHGITGWRPLVFGSIAEKLVEQAQCPVLLLRTPKP